MSDTTTKKKLAEIKTNLFASQDVLVMKAIQDASELGDASLVEPLVQVMADTDNQSIRDTIHTMLGELKISAAEAILIDTAEQDRFAAIQDEILSFVWSSGFQPVDHLEALCRMATTGKYEAAIEVFTIFDTLDGPFPEESVLDAEMVLNEWMGKEGNGRSEKAELIKTIQANLANMHHHLED